MTWSAVLLFDGQPVSGAVPCDDWIAASVMAEWFASWLPGPISVGQAVVANRSSDPEPVGLFAEDAA